MNAPKINEMVRKAFLARFSDFPLFLWLLLLEIGRGLLLSCRLGTLVCLSSAGAVLEYFCVCEVEVENGTGTLLGFTTGVVDSLFVLDASVGCNSFSFCIISNLYLGILLLLVSFLLKDFCELFRLKLRRKGVANFCMNEFVV